MSDLTIRNCYRILIRVPSIDVACEALNRLDFSAIPVATWEPPAGATRIDYFAGVVVEILE